MPRFNLIDEPWIPCLLGRGGILRDLSLREALVKAVNVREVVDPSPPVTAALHRFLLAIVHRNFGPGSRRQWREMWKAGAWDEGVLAAYLGRWYRRFDIFDEEHPFYQVKGLDFQYEGPVSKLAPELASGNNATLFDHSTDAATEAIAPAWAARWLVAHQAFAIGGLVSLEKGQNPKLFKSADNGPLVKGAVVIVKGDNLFRTLMLNLHHFSSEDEEPFPSEPDDWPAWEREEETRPEDRQPRGYLDLLTWQSRRIRLRPEVEADGRVVVRRVVVMKGNQFPEGFMRHGKETMLGFTKRSKAKENEDPWPAVSFREDRAMWRDSLALFESVEEKRARPKILDWLNDLAAEGIVERSQTMPMDLLGLVTDRAKVLLWRHERLPLPLAYLENKELLESLRVGLEVAEGSARALEKGIWVLAALIAAPDSDRAGARQPRRESVEPLFKSLAPGRLYWPRLEVPFRKFLVDLPSDVVAEEELVEYGRERLPEWVRSVRQAAVRSFEEVAGGLDGSPRTLKAVAAAEGAFRRDLSAALKDYLKQ